MLWFLHPFLEQMTYLLPFVVGRLMQSKPAVITTHEEKPHGLGEGDYVDFTEVRLQLFVCEQKKQGGGGDVL